MALNKSKGNMYDFINHTWNPIKGKCFHDCSYCYMKRWGNQKPVRLDEKEFKTDLGKDNFIFVGSSCDIFAEDIPDNWIYSILNYCQKYNNKYFFQSKNPKRFKLIKNWMDGISMFFCTTLESNRDYPKIMNNSPKIENRLVHYIDYITIEPILDFDVKELLEMIIMCQIKQVNIGADSGHNDLPEPPKEKIFELIAELEKFTKVKLKKNLNRLLKEV